MKRCVLHIFLALATGLWAGDIDVARQALKDGVWRSAIAAADLAATNAADRAEARLISLEALANLDEDAEIRKRLGAWTDETGDDFRYWRARSLVRVGDFQQAKVALEKPFSNDRLNLPVACLKAHMQSAAGDKEGAIETLSGLASQPPTFRLAAEDAQLMLGELLGMRGKTAESRALLSPLAENAGRKSVRLRAGYLLGFSEMGELATRTAGVSRVRAMLRKDPGDEISVRAARAFGDRLLDFGDAAGADEEYRRYLEVNPSAVTDAEMLEHRGRAMFMLGRNSEAAGAFARAEQAATNVEAKARAAFFQAESFLRDGRGSEAAASFGRSAEYGGADALRAKFSQADALERAGEADSAERIYGEISKGGGEWGARSDLRLAAIMARKGQLSEAIKGDTDLIAKSNLLSAAETTEAYLGRGRAYYREYGFKEAEADFEMVAARDPARSDGMRFLLALCLYGAGRDVDAKSAAESLMMTTKNPGLRADLMLWCAKYEFNHGEYADARTHFETYADMKGGTTQSAEALLWAARCSSALTDYSKAVDLATQAATNKAIFIEALLVQGEALMELGRYPEAAQVFDRAMTQATDSGNVAKAAALKADALYAMGAGDNQRYEEAITAYRALENGNALSPDRKIEVAFKIGRALEKLRRSGEAMDQYYKNVVLTYSAGTADGILFSAPTRTFFSRAAFSLADYFEAAGDMRAVKSVLERVATSGVPAAEAAKKRLAELKSKGNIP